MVKNWTREAASTSVRLTPGNCISPNQKNISGKYVVETSRLRYARNFQLHNSLAGYGALIGPDTCQQRLIVPEPENDGFLIGMEVGSVSAGTMATIHLVSSGTPSQSQLGIVGGEE